MLLFVLNGYVVAYDVDCGPCTQFKRLVDLLDGYDRISFVSLKYADDQGLLDKIPESIRFDSFHLIFPDGEAKSGAEALPDLISLFPLGRPISKFIVLLPGGKRVIRFLYYRFAKLRKYSSCSLKDNNRVH